MNECKKSIALGTFDGFHLGHQSVIELSKKSGYMPYVLLFSDHPLKCIKGQAPPEILTKSIRKKLLDEMNVGALNIDFSEIMHLSPESFVRDILVNRFSAGAVSCGENYTFGENGSGNIDTLRLLCRKYGIELYVSPMVKFGGSEISSTRIRAAIKSGDMQAAAEMLGRPFSYDFTVTAGDRRGHLLGFPTINQFFPENFVEPLYGVYASYVNIGGRDYPAVTDFGLRPTIGTSTVRSETCILGFSGDLYGSNTEVRLLKFIRGEKKFDSLSALSAQIKSDSESAVKIFQNTIAKNA